MKINERNKDTIEKIHLLTGETKGAVRQFFESLIFILTVDYINNESTNIPFFGEITIKNMGDTLEKGGKRVNLVIEFDPEDIFQTNVGQIEDGEQSELEKVLRNRIRNSLSNYME